MKKIVIFSLFILNYIPLTAQQYKNEVGVDFFPTIYPLLQTIDGRDFGIEFWYKRSTKTGLFRSKLGLKTYYASNNSVYDTLLLSQNCLRVNRHTITTIFYTNIGYAKKKKLNKIMLFYGIDLNIGIGRGRSSTDDYGECGTSFGNSFSTLAQVHPTNDLIIGITPFTNLQIPITKRLKFTGEIGIALNYFIGMRRIRDEAGTLISEDYRAWRSNFRENWLINDIGISYLF